MLFARAAALLFWKGFLERSLRFISQDLSTDSVAGLWKAVLCLWLDLISAGQFGGMLLWLELQDQVILVQLLTS